MLESGFRGAADVADRQGRFAAGLPFTAGAETSRQGGTDNAGKAQRVEPPVDDDQLQGTGKNAIGQAIWKRLTDCCSVLASDSRCFAIPAIESTVPLTCALLVAMAPTFCDISLLVLLCSRR